MTPEQERALTNLREAIVAGLACLGAMGSGPPQGMTAAGARAVLATFERAVREDERTALAAAVQRRA